ncbi:MAG: LLM class flavin-dependent oxidoreductase [Mucilaginibacter polytrichastri]|nr:LLM class flavin-dependent oxidoreductase [Mucilaginibacter polytrichastri]
MAEQQIRLSVLDQSPVRKGTSAAQALQETFELARLADELGYHRYWLAEHHNTSALAGTTPEILIGLVAEKTKKIRVGSGGIMLPNHSALKVAESFRMLEALYPGRIDLGMGRAPGTDRITASMLNPSNTFSEQSFIDQLYELQHYFHDTAEPGTIQEKIKAYPDPETVPPIWLLSSSGQSGVFAAHFGMGFSFAHFINPSGGPEAVQMYRDRFTPSEDLAEPQANAAFFIFISEDEEKVRRQQAVMDFRFISLERGKGFDPVAYEDVKSVSYSLAEQERIRVNRRRTIAGSAGFVHNELLSLVKKYDIDELMAVTICEDFDDRLESYRLLAKAFSPQPVADPA